MDNIFRTLELTRKDFIETYKKREYCFHNEKRRVST